MFKVQPFAGRACSLALLLMSGSSMLAQTAIGDPKSENHWDSREAVIAVRSSTKHGDNVPEHLIDGSGIDETGNQSKNEGLFLSGSLIDSQATPRGGTVVGGHWVEFEFDRPYHLSAMWIWNYGARSEEYDWRKLGFKSVTIQCSMTGGSDPKEWQTVFEGEIPMAETLVPDFLTPVSLVVELGGVEAKFVVITSADTPDHNWCSTLDPNGEVLEHSGLSEVRFFSR